MKRLVLLLAAAAFHLVFGSPSVQGQTAYALFEPQVSPPSTLESIEGASRLFLDRPELEKLLTERPSELRFDLPLADGGAWDVRLAAVPILAPAFRLTTASGTASTYAPGHHCQGYVVGRPDVRVAASLSAHGVMLVALAPEGQYNLGPVGSPARKGSDYVFFREDQARVELPRRGCSFLETQRKNRPDDRVMAEECPVVTKYYECDYWMFRDLGRDVAAVAHYVEGLHNVVALLYDREGIRTTIAEIFVWDKPDPYPNGRETIQMLEDFNRRDPLGSSPERNAISLGHLLSSQDGLWSWGYIGALCERTRYAVSTFPLYYEELPFYTWTVTNLAHEMGHNLNSRHTHNCAWPGGPIDGCASVETDITLCDQPPRPRRPFQGTIMSHCYRLSDIGINLSLGFGPLPGDVIREHVEYAPCLLYEACACHTPVLFSVRALPDGTSAKLQWMEAPRVLGYEVSFRRTDLDTFSSAILTEGLSYTITGMKPGAKYEIRVRARCDERADTPESAWASQFLALTEPVATGGCDGLVTLTEPDGLFSDGTLPSETYANNVSCEWHIAPPGAKGLRLTLYRLRTELNSDPVVIVHGSDPGGRQISMSGRMDAPPQVYDVPVGSARAFFSSNGAVTDYGWTFGYQAIYGTSLPCNEEIKVEGPEGRIDDGSGAALYNSGSRCRWLIDPMSDEMEIEIDFVSFQTEAGFDFVSVYEGPGDWAPLLGRFSGRNLPPRLIARSRYAYVVFESDATVRDAGWELEYRTRPQISEPCQSLTVHETPSGSFDDGSGNDLYANDQRCAWLIRPPDAIGLSITLSEFNTEAGADILRIYDGPDADSPLIIELSGNSESSVRTFETSAGVAFVTFETDGRNRRSGWHLSYAPGQGPPPPTCEDKQVLTESSGLVEAGNRTDYYTNNLDCEWLIDAGLQEPLNLRFVRFNTEQDADIVSIYDGPYANPSSLLLQHSGRTVPSTVRTTRSQALIRFTTNASVQHTGWAFDYSYGGTSRAASAAKVPLSLWPNPASARVLVDLADHAGDCLFLDAIDASGRAFSPDWTSKNEGIELDVSNWPAGLYALRLRTANGLQVGRLVVQKAR